MYNIRVKFLEKEIKFVPIFVCIYKYLHVVYNFSFPNYNVFELINLGYVLNQGRSGLDILYVPLVFTPPPLPPP